MNRSPPEDTLKFQFLREKEARNVLAGNISLIQRGSMQSHGIIALEFSYPSSPIPMTAYTGLPGYRANAAALVPQPQILDSSMLFLILTPVPDRYAHHPDEGYKPGN